MLVKPNILVVCGKNKRRSRSAEHIFKNDSRFNIISAGLSSKSERKISEKDIAWADLIFVMERDQQKTLREEFLHLEIPPIEVLGIPDEYEYLNAELILLLHDGINDTLHKNYKI
jgi:predicted protein tyrosine phosphatase